LKFQCRSYNNPSILQNETLQLLAYADDVNLLGDNMGTIKKSTETLIDASKEVGLKNIENMLLSCHRNAGQNCDKEIGNRSFENVS
jgi:hypothetical protein